MKKLITAMTTAAFVFAPFSASALTQVDGYYRDDGTYVEPHYRSDPDGYEYNNLGSDGIDVDNDGYGAAETNSIYDHEIDESSLDQSYRDTYNSYDSGYNSYDSYDSTYDSYEYDSGYDSYDYDTGYDSYDYDSYDYDSGYDSYDSYDYSY